MSVISALTATADAVDAFFDLAMPPGCAGCGAPATRWCRTCLVHLHRLSAQEPIRVSVSATVATPPLPVWAAGFYDGPLRHALLAFKESGRRDTLPVLAALLHHALRPALELTLDTEVLVVPVPSSRAARRRRGEVPTTVLGRRAVDPEAAARFAPVLAHRRRVLDNAGLNRRQRQVNLHGAFGVRPGAAVFDRSCIVVDDIVTTGASLHECARALRAAGGRPVAAAVIASTPVCDHR